MHGHTYSGIHITHTHTHTHATHTLQGLHHAASLLLIPAPAMQVMLRLFFHRPKRWRINRSELSGGRLNRSAPSNTRDEQIHPTRVMNRSIQHAWWTGSIQHAWWTDPSQITRTLSLCFSAGGPVRFFPSFLWPWGFWLKSQVQAKLTAPPPPHTHTHTHTHTPPHVLWQIWRCTVWAPPSFLLQGPSDTLVPS